MIHKEILRIPEVNSSKRNEVMNSQNLVIILIAGIFFSSLMKSSNKRNEFQSKEKIMKEFQNTGSLKRT
jgi:hypothetical protein